MGRSGVEDQPVASLRSREASSSREKAGVAIRSRRCSLTPKKVRISPQVGLYAGSLCKSDWSNVCTACEKCLPIFNRMISSLPTKCAYLSQSDTI